MAKYDNAFKYKMIELLCDRKNAKDLGQKYSILGRNLMMWLRKHIAYYIILRVLAMPIKPQYQQTHFPGYVYPCYY